MTPFMSKTQVKISQIEKADLIRYYIIPENTQALLVIYNGNKSINLCEYEDFFSMLAKQQTVCISNIPTAVSINIPPR